MGAAEEIQLIVKEAPAWRLLGAEAKIRGFRNAPAFRRWLKKMKVSIRRSGRFEIVFTHEVDVAMLNETKPVALDPLRAAAEASVAKAVAGGKR